MIIDDSWFYTDQKGFAQANLPQKWRVPGLFLEYDVQCNLTSTQKLRQRIGEFRADPTHEPWQGTGNAWTIYLTPDGARIECALSDDEPSCALSLDELDGLLAGWENMLTSPRDPHR